MYRITVEEEKNGVYTKVENACLETTGYILMAEQNNRKGANYQIMNLCSMDLMNMLLNNDTLLKVIIMALPVLPMAIKGAEEGHELPPEIDVEGLLKVFPSQNSGGGVRRKAFLPG